MQRSRICGFSCFVLSILVLVSGCPSSGPSTVPVKGTLTIDGKPATDVAISLFGSDPKVPAASGKVENGSFTLFCGIQGKPGAVPGKYKVVLSSTAGGGAQMYQSGAGAAAKISLPFPEKYKDASTSDKEIEIVNGSNDLKITIP